MKKKLTITITVSFIALIALIVWHKNSLKYAENDKASFIVEEPQENSFTTSDAYDPNNDNYLCYVNNRELIEDSNIFSYAAIYKLEEELDLYLRNNGYSKYIEGYVVERSVKGTRDNPQFDLYLPEYDLILHVTYRMTDYQYQFIPK